MDKSDRVRLAGFCSVRNRMEGVARVGSAQEKYSGRAWEERGSLNVGYQSRWNKDERLGRKWH